MPRYEYRCEGCGLIVELPEREAEDHENEAGGRCGPLFRRWSSFGVVWPAGERGH